MVDETTKTVEEPVVLTDAQKAAAKATRQQNELTTWQTNGKAVIARIAQINDKKNATYPANADRAGDYENIGFNATDSICDNLMDARLFGKAMQSGIDILVKRHNDANFLDLATNHRNPTTAKTQEQLAQEKADLDFATPIGQAIFSMADGQNLGSKGYNTDETVQVNGQSHNPSNLYNEATLIKMVVAMCVNARATRQVVVKPAVATATTETPTGGAQ